MKHIFQSSFQTKVPPFATKMTLKKNSPSQEKVNFYLLEAANGENKHEYLCECHLLTVEILTSFFQYNTAHDNHMLDTNFCYGEATPSLKSVNFIFSSKISSQIYTVPNCLNFKHSLET